MLQLAIDMLPFAVFVAIGIFVFAEPASPRNAAATKLPRPRTFSQFSDGGTLILADPDGKPAPRSR